MVSVSALIQVIFRNVRQDDRVRVLWSRTKGWRPACARAGGRWLRGGRAVNGTDGLWLAREELRRHRARPDAARGQRLPDRERLREAGIWTPILMLTARDGDSTRPGPRRRCRRQPTKPFATRAGRPAPGAACAAERRSARWARRRRSPRSRRGTCWRGEDSSTSPRERWSLLEFLMRRAGEVGLEDGHPGPRVGRRLRG